MKQYILYAIFFFLVTSCDKGIIIAYEGRAEAEFIIPLGLNTVETHFITVKDVPTFFRQNAERFNVDTTNIKNVQASKGLLRAKFNDAEFDFIERISVWAVSQKDPNFKREMYYLDFNPLNTREELRMLSSTSELKQILNNDFINLEFRLNLRRFPTSNIRTIFDFGYAVSEN
jgi:hypothetical protein